MKDKQNRDNEDDIIEIKKYISGIKAPYGTNQSGKNLLLEKIRNVENEINTERSHFRFSFFPQIPRPLFFKFGVAALLALFLIISFTFIVTSRINKLQVSYEIDNGNILLNGKSSNKKNLDKNDEIQTMDESEMTIKVNDSSVKLFEKTMLKMMENRKTGNISINRFNLMNGKIYCSVRLESTDSIFEVDSNDTSFTVKGTKFLIDLKDNQDIVLQVDEGIVDVENFLNMDENDKSEIPDFLIAIIDKKISVRKNETIIIHHDILEKMNGKIRDLSLAYNIDSAFITGMNELNDLLVENIDNKNFFFKSDDPAIINDGDLSEKLKENEKNFTVKKTMNITAGSVNDAGIISYAGNGKIVFFSDRSIYCINVNKNILEWKIDDNRFGNITSRPEYINGNIILTTPTTVFAVDEDGKIIYEYKVNKGINYWPDLVEYKNGLLIPGADGIYYFSDDGFKKIENIQEPDGQLYVSRKENNLYIFNMNSLALSEYDLDRSEITKEYKNLQARSFMSPVINGNSLFIADQNGNIYKYDVSNSGLSPEMLKINSGITGLLSYDTALYFVANDGYFYKIDAASFDTVIKIASVDQKPDKDMYLKKRLMVLDGVIYFSSDTGKIFSYDVKKINWNFVPINDNIDGNPLIGTPVRSVKSIYFIDNMTNIYEMSYR